MSSVAIDRAGARKRLLIRTLPPIANYGGILQAYALQQAVKAVGFEAVTDVSIPSSVARQFRRGVYQLKRNLLPAPWILREVNDIISAPARQFVEERMATVDLYKGRSQPRREDWHAYDALIVGSDQIWRRAYGDVESYLLDFAYEHEGVNRIAYAGSFGVDELLDYPPELVARTKALAQRFSAMSVREESGVELAERSWQVSAERMPDPTFLLEPTHYRELADLAPREGSDHSAFVAAYILDPSREKAAALESLGENLGIPVRRVVPSPPASAGHYRVNPASFTKPTVERWLWHFSNAEYVVTDSFHGVVFSLLFQKPFVAIGNSERGLTRFQSVLTRFRLSERLAAEDELGSLPALLQSGVDWTSVDDIRIRERDLGMRFLASKLP